jgi:hypothetical protein
LTAPLLSASPAMKPIRSAFVRALAAFSRVGTLLRRSDSPLLNHAGGIGGWSAPADLPRAVESKRIAPPAIRAGLVRAFDRTVPIQVRGGPGAATGCLP